MLRRASVHLIRNCKAKGGGGPAPFWTEGKKPAAEGILFGETPPPPGQTRKWESWEAPWYLAYGAMFFMGVVIAYGKPEEASTIRAWAKPRALKELEEEDAIFAQLKESEHLEEVKGQMLSLGKHFDEYYDLVMSRKELTVMKEESA